jgi:hypothetical protein
MKKMKMSSIPVGKTRVSITRRLGDGGLIALYENVDDYE